MRTWRRTSSVALKILMATTGILLVLFLYAHMAGNLKMFRLYLFSRRR